MRTINNEVESGGFTRADLCALLGAAALLGVVLVPAMASGGRGVGQVICQDNLRRLAAAWVMYADENGGRLVGNFHGGMADNPIQSDPRNPWAVGWLTWDTSQDNTNTLYLTDPKYAALSPYVGGAASVYRCPEDTTVGGAQRAARWTARSRSYSMNWLMNVADDNDNVPGYRIYRRLSDMNALAPSQALLFLEEHPDSINDPAFWHRPASTIWTDVPSALHDGASWTTFADGHVESRQWTSPTVRSPVRFRWSSGTGPAEQADLQWITEHFGEKK